METKRKALGKGLEQLFSNESLYVDPIEEIVENTPKEDIVEVKISELRSNPYQPRKTFNQEKLEELADSIKEYGILEPIIIKKSIKGFEIVAGERRTKAAKLAGLETIPAIIKDFSENEMMEIALLENVQREDLTAIEEAEAYYSIIKTLNVTQEQLAKKLGKSRTHITNMLGLLRLPDVVKMEVLSGNISMGHARVLSKLEDKDVIINLCQRIMSEKLSVHELENIVSSGSFEKVKKVNRTKYNQYSYVEEYVTEKIGHKVKINNNKLIIPFTNQNDLDTVLKKLGIEVSIDE